MVLGTPSCFLRMFNPGPSALPSSDFGFLLLFVSCYSGIFTIQHFQVFCNHGEISIPISKLIFSASGFLYASRHIHRYMKLPRPIIFQLSLLPKLSMNSFVPFVEHGKLGIVCLRHSSQPRLRKIELHNNPWSFYSEENAAAGFLTNVFWILGLFFVSFILLFFNNE